jgi:curved DNA-binding protein CbpA
MFNTCFSKIALLRLQREHSVSLALSQAYRVRIKELHPDVSGGADTTVAMVELNIAYDDLVKVWFHMQS